MNYPPAIVANALLYRARQRGITLDHMKLQKLVFLVHGWSLALYNQPAVNQPPDAWTYGPVFGELYSALRGSGRAPITNLIPTFDPVAGKVQPLIPAQADANTWRLVDQVLDRYGSLSAVQLSTMSHEPGGPWDVAKRSAQPITNESIRVHYLGKLERGAG